MKQSNITKTFQLIILSVFLLLVFSNAIFAGETTYMAVGDLRTWYHSAGCEIEVGRTSATADQQDGLIWPAQFPDQDNSAAKALWIGSTNYNDPIAARIYPYKVVHIGPRVIDENNEFIPQECLVSLITLWLLWMDWVQQN